MKIIRPLLLLVGLLAAPASQAVMLELVNGEIEVRLFSLPPVAVAQQPASLSVSVAPDGSFALPGALFASTVTPIGPLTINGPPLGIQWAISNLAGAFAPGSGIAGGFGGTLAVGPGRSILCGIPPATLPITRFNPCLLNLPIFFDPVGVGGTVSNGGGFITPATVTGARWTTGLARVTNVVTPNTAGTTLVPTTLSLSGADLRTPGGRGTLTMVTPIRIQTSLLGGRAGGFAVATLHFVPEPGTALPVALGAAAFACAGWRARGRHRRGADAEADG